MKKIVETLYSKILSDEALIPFFKGFDVARIKSQQEHVMAMLFGGRDLLGDEYPRFDIRSMHYRPIMELGLGVKHFELWVNHFRETLEEIGGIPEETKANAMIWMSSTRSAFEPLTPQEIEEYHSRMANSGGKCPLQH